LTGLRRRRRRVHSRSFKLSCERIGYGRSSRQLDDEALFEILIFGGANVAPSRRSRRHQPQGPLPALHRLGPVGAILALAATACSSATEPGEPNEAGAPLDARSA
jgi:hypothetical protein